MNKKQSGFSFIETIIAILVLAVVGFGGYTVWRNQHKKPDANTTLGVNDYMSCQAHGGKVTQTRPHNTCSLNGKTYTATQIPVDIIPKPTPSTSQSYLLINEWGVKMPLSSEITDTYYMYKNGYVYLSTNKLRNTDCAADATTLGVITRYSAGDINPDTGSPYSTDTGSYSVKIGDYYYFYTHPQASCSQDQVTEQAADADMALLKAAVDKLQAK